MKLYNSLTNKLEEFNSIEDGKVSIYVCGPTVYNYIHIGNARPIVTFDVLRNYFDFLGYEVLFVSNFTDVDDKIIKKAIESGKTENEITKKFIDAYNEDLKRLNVSNPNITPKATEYINQMIEYIKELINKGFAYEVNGNVYFRVSKLPIYGELSNQKLENLQAGARIEENKEKENPSDFTLWKKTSEGINWDSPFSKGRPGWHTECVCIINDIFNSKIDIHAGGSDLKFPHHENEIAQSQALHNHSIANFWLHNGRLNLDNEKMSKSLGNVILVKDLLNEISVNEFKYLLLSTQYRQPLNYNSELLSQAKKNINKISTTLKQLSINSQILDSSDKVIEDDILISNVDNYYTTNINEFMSHMDNDLNTPNVITLIHKLVKEANKFIRAKEDVYANCVYLLLTDIFKVLGFEFNVLKLTEDDIFNYKSWLDARANKNFELADNLRDTLSSRGIL